MSRCERIRDLEVHHVRIDGDNSIDNARVLCKQCHRNTSTYCDPNHKSPPAFSQETKEKALKRAGYSCECTKGTCCL